MKKRTLVLLFLSVLIALSFVSGVHASEFKLTASDGAADDGFGVSVAINGDYALIDSPGKPGGIILVLPISSSGV
jgi:archaellum component FlaG (FlaF/FlaG flagellin family)